LAIYITVQRFSREYASIADIPDNEQCVALGSSAEVRAAINRYFPAVDWSDSGLSERWQALDCSEGSFLEKSLEPEAGLENWTAYRNQILGGRQ
jgi:hypothetical protein